MREEKAAGAREAPLSRLVPCLVASAAFAAFAPALRNQFVDWDDTINLVGNLSYRGLAWEQIRWMFAAPRFGHYVPLTWLTFGLDYTLWGMNPAGYHLTNLLLHAANAALFYFVARRLLAAAAPAARGPRLDLAAAVSALFFALHPLRVESVVWATERRDLLSGFFYLLAIISYIRKDVGDRRPPYASYAFFALSLLSKSAGITLPFILLILDVYPLRRFAGEPHRIRRLLLEKIPYLLAALPSAAMTFVAAARLKAVVGLGGAGAARRLALSSYSSVFYLTKTIAPVRLLPFYETPVPLEPFAGRYVLCGVFIAALTAILYAARRRFPAGLAVWAAYFAALAPVLAFVTVGDYYAADRYTYLPSLGFALLLGGAVLNGRRRLLLAAAVLAALGVLSWRQAGAWRDTETLWRRAFAIEPRNSMTRHALGDLLAARGQGDEAIGHYRAVAEIRPDLAGPSYNSWGIVLAGQGRYDEAMGRYLEALRLNPGLSDARNNLGMELARRGRLDEAMLQYREAIALNAESDRAHNNLGAALAGRGRWPEAEAQYREAVRIKPSYAEAWANLGFALDNQGRPAEAVEAYRRALALRPDLAAAAAALANATARLQPAPR